MRYAHMVNEPVHELPRVRRSGSTTWPKHIVTLSLNFRQKLLATTSFGSSVVLVLIATPFFLAILLHRSSPRGESSPVHDVQLLPADNAANTELTFAAEMDMDAMQVELEKDLKARVEKRANISLAAFGKFMKKRRKYSKAENGGVSLIAACKDRRESVELAIASWESVEGIDEMVVVDWSSKESWDGMLRLQGMVSSGRTSLVRVEDAGDWVLSRAYNLAARVATGNYLLRVDCDTHLDPDFLDVHPPPGAGKYYTVAWGTEREDIETRLRGVWFARKSDFEKAGGYDERITQYGYEDTDLYGRLDRVAGLVMEPLLLDKINHMIINDFIGSHSNETSPYNAMPPTLSVRMNQAMIKNARETWAVVRESKKVSEYSFQLNPDEGFLVARQIQSAPCLSEMLPSEERNTLRIEILQATLHDEFHIPWDVIPDLAVSDMEYLVEHLSSETTSESRVVFAVFQGPDAISNLFNLVSVLQLGMNLGRPIIVVWNSPPEAPALPENPRTNYISYLFDLEATNELVRQAVELEGPGKEDDGVVLKPTRLIGARSWRCGEDPSTCASYGDKAYANIEEHSVRLPRMYDEVDPIPLSVLRHGLLRLSDKLKIGNEASRAHAFKALVQSHEVRAAQAAIVTASSTSSLGVVMPAGKDAHAVAQEFKSEHAEIIEDASVKNIPAIGSGSSRLEHLAFRAEIFGEEARAGSCQPSACGLQEQAYDLASALAVCAAEAVWPSVPSAPERSEWMTTYDRLPLMVSDLRALSRNY